MSDTWTSQIVAAALAFRGYNTTNLGRSAELLAHPQYGPTVEHWLREASELCSAAGGQPVDLVARLRAGQESSLATFGADIGLIVGMELAQLELLKTFGGVDYRQAQVMFGYSLGEITALVAGGVYEMRDVLPPLVALAADSAALADGATMGVLFSRGPEIDFDLVKKVCSQVTAAGQGVLAVSSHLAPNAFLLLGQGDTLERFRARMVDVFGKHVQLRRNQERWPPLHTPLLWERHIRDRAGVLMHTMRGGFTAPQPPVLSLVTGRASYNDHNSREIILRWLDEPQRLWEAIYELLSIGIELVVHVGPAPNLIPATFKRLSDNVASQVKGTHFSELRLAAARGITHRPWLTRLLPAQVALLRAPFVTHLVLEDWLLDLPRG